MNGHFLDLRASVPGVNDRWSTQLDTRMTASCVTVASSQLDQSNTFAMPTMVNMSGLTSLRENAPHFVV